MTLRSASVMTRLLRSGPAMQRSMASSTSGMPMVRRLRRAARSAASFMRLARSAPVKPGVSLARLAKSTPAPRGLPSEWTRRICSRPLTSGRSTVTWRSKRPGRSSAGSRMSGRLVAAIRMTASFSSKPSISTSSWLSVCSRSSWPPPTPAPRWRPTASISSMKMMQGAASLACLNRSRTRLAPTPTNISTKSEPEIEKNGTPASPATALARSVLPVPGGPTRSTPRGILAPIFWKRSGSDRKSRTSRSSSTASSMPATSENLTLGRVCSLVLALVLPNPMALPFWPCIWLRK